MSQQNKQNFMDPKTIMAVILVGVIFIGWQYYLKNKYPDLYEEKTPQAVVEKSVQDSNQKATPSGITAVTKQRPLNQKVDELAEAVNVEEKLLPFNSDVWSFEVSSRGMGLKNIVLKKFKDRDDKPMKMGADTEKLSFETTVIGKNNPVFFDVKQTHDNEFVGKARVGNTTIEKRYIINSETNSIETKIFVTGIEQDDRFTGLVTYISESITANESSSFMPRFEKQEIFVAFDGDDERIVVNDEDVSESFSKVSLVSLGSQYFTFAMLDKSDILPEVKASVSQAGKVIEASLIHNILSRTQDFNVNFVAFAGPKSLSLLNEIDSAMASIIDFGFFSSLGFYILKLMKLFYQFVGNWGVAIVLLTIVVRLVVLPFNLMSFKSMKKMQDIQPQIKALREKLKEDPQKLNQEMMVLMRSNKVNPLGGCLPMLLQFPVFIALYQVLGQSIELYQAPFAFWITDLSLKDPFYVLPVLMGVTMFLQQKITPSTMDPAQQKIFMFMPIVFALFMVSLPSGLTLYIFVSALFAVIQQYVFMKDKRKTA